MPLPVPTSAIRSGSLDDLAACCFARSNSRISKNSVSGRGMSTSGVTRNAERIELAPADQVGHRHALGPLAHELAELLPHGFGGLLVERGVELNSRAAQGMGQQHFGVEPRAFGVALAQEVGRPGKQPADRPNFFGLGHGQLPPRRQSMVSMALRCC